MDSQVLLQSIVSLTNRLSKISFYCASVNEEVTHVLSYIAVVLFLFFSLYHCIMCVDKDFNRHILNTSLLNQSAQSKPFLPGLQRDALV